MPFNAIHSFLLTYPLNNFLVDEINNKSVFTPFIYKQYSFNTYTYKSPDFIYSYQYLFPLFPINPYKQYLNQYYNKQSLNHLSNHIFFITISPLNFIKIFYTNLYYNNSKYLYFQSSFIQPFPFIIFLILSKLQYIYFIDQYSYSNFIQIISKYKSCTFYNIIFNNDQIFIISHFFNKIIYIQFINTQFIFQNSFIIHLYITYFNSYNTFLNQHFHTNINFLTKSSINPYFTPHISHLIPIFPYIIKAFKSFPFHNTIHNHLLFSILFSQFFLYIHQFTNLLNLIHNHKSLIHNQYL